MQIGKMEKVLIEIYLEGLRWFRHAQSAKALIKES
jgi:hypothetical protein